MDSPGFQSRVISSEKKCRTVSERLIRFGLMKLMNRKFLADKLSQLLGDYRSDDSESNDADCDAGKSKNDANNETDAKADTSKPCTPNTTAHCSISIKSMIK